ncbi:glucose-6-phosphatase 3 [Bombina bombina]|uniref:glucose-6-phosphatase 3 n=1 Tax=Bombina bombina TaxID=8345 RepID=UPI00235A9590|nr:glucose-6-phosphatase 3 [Bombina bombina]
MDQLHRTGIELAAILQERLPGSEDFWLWVTYLGDPSCILLFYFPIALAIQHRLGLTVLWIGLISEWLNLVFKWFLFGERPFWWVSESGQFNDLKLRQFPSTCETGPGSPSGHCMITGAALWPVLTTVTTLLSQRRVQRLLPLILYILLMVGVAVSRVFILAHFPHQVLAGILTGVFLGHILQRDIPVDRSFGFYALASLLLLLGALLINWVMSTIGFDLSWSIHLATKWCSKPEWIRIETRPFSSMTRSAGSALGLGLALHCPLYDRFHRDNASWRERTVSLFLSLFFLKILNSLQFPISTPLYFYSLNFLRHSLCPLAAIILAPLITQVMGFRTPKRD